MKGSKLNAVVIYFIPTIDENDGNLIYVAEPFIKLKYFEKAIIVMPHEFSIVLEEEEEAQKVEPSRIVKLTFWDLVETFPALFIAATFIIYHNMELDQIGKQLEGYGNQIWGAQEDHILDMVSISRELYVWLKEQLGIGAMDKNLVQECMNFHKRLGIVGIDENDEVQKYFFERALLMKRREHINRVKIQSSISGVADLFEKEAYLKAEQFWEKLKGEGKILYFPPGESPLF